MESKLHLDFETRGSIDLLRVGARLYSEHPDTGIWCTGFAFDDDEPSVMAGEVGMPLAVAEHIEEGGLVYAHNAAFEWYIWNNVARRDNPKLPVLRASQLRCTAAMCAAYALPTSLEDAARALRFQDGKDTLGKALMKKFAVPWRTDPLRWMDENPQFTLQKRQWTGSEGLERLFEYCKQDVEVERNIERTIPALTPFEQSVYILDLGINHYGVRIDKEGIELCLQAIERCADQNEALLNKLTEGHVQTPTALESMREFLAQQGVETASLDKEAVRALLARVDLPDVVRQVLEIRQAAGKSSNAKFQKMLNTADEGDRLYGQFAYHNAATGRWAGRGVQLQNMPRGTPKPEAIDSMLRAIEAGDEVSLEDVSRAIRGMILPDEGHVFVGGDFGQVEGRGTGWFCGEEWKVEAFRLLDAGNGPDIYEATAARILGKPVEEVTKDERQAYGKVPELALGYGGGAGAFKSMAAIYGVELEDEQVDKIVSDWRKLHPNVCKTWYELEDAARAAVRMGGKVFSAGAKGREVRFCLTGPHLYCELPSGRTIVYPFAKIRRNDRKGEVTYMKVRDPNADRGQIIKDEYSFGRWQRVTTWGGKLLENVVQALCRDLLAYTMVRLRREGNRVVLHVHDEARCSVPKDQAESKAQEFAKIMTETPAWAKDFPLACEIDITERYGK